jgi:molecular chaperone HtpG
MLKVWSTPDIPLNVSRSGYKLMLPLKKISNYITRKVADKLKSLFTESREDFEQKMERYQNRFKTRNVIEDKFYEKAGACTLL